MEKLVYRVSEACELLGISRSQGYVLIRENKLPAIKIGESWRVPATTLRQWIDAKVAAGEETR
jgi:excisionase family DNA binding protein